MTNFVTIAVPPLTQRATTVLLLSGFLCMSTNKISARVMT
jgi:hypothetical protein